MEKRKQEKRKQEKRKQEKGKHVLLVLLVLQKLRNPAKAQKPQQKPKILLTLSHLAQNNGHQRYRKVST
jgi:hypothetical protein